MPRHRRHGMTVASCRGAPRGTLGATHDSLPTDPVGRRPTGRALCSAAMPVLRLRSIAALGALAAAAAAQDVEVAGTVTDASGQPIAGAEVTFLPLPVAARPRTGSKGRYQIAQAAHRAATRLPRTRTARDGTFRCLVSPQVAALAAGSGVELAMQVQAPGYHTWMRAIGDRLEGASGSVVVLTPARAGRLRVRVATPVEGGCRGFAVIERAFRARHDRTVSLRTVLPLDEHGAVAFDEPARVPGEIEAALPTARAEGYRVTLYVLGLDRWQGMLTEGKHELHVERSAFPPRRVLAERGEPAKTPIDATFELHGEEVTLRLDTPAVPLLGDEPPVRVHSASGPVTVDAWDPDQPLFVEPPPEEAAPVAGAPTRVEREVRLVVRDRAGEALLGAAVWVEDSAARTMDAGRTFAVTGPTGTARLSGLPPGMHWLLVRHPTAGEREVLCDTARESLLEVELRDSPAAPARANLVPQAGTVLVDLEAARTAETVEVGIVQAGGRILRRVFSDGTRRVRLEGLPPGPVTVWARVDGGPAHVVAGVLATGEERPAVEPLRAPARTFVLDVRQADGGPARDVALSLGDTAPKGRKPLTAALLPLTPEGDRLKLALHLSGDAWVVVHGPAGEQRDVLLRDEGGPPVVEVTLPPPPPPPPAEGGGAQEQKGGDKQDDKQH